MNQFCSSLIVEDKIEAQHKKNMTAPKNVTSREEMIHQALVNESLDVGIMFSSKAFVQLITNPFIGPLTHR